MAGDSSLYTNYLSQQIVKGWTHEMPDTQNAEHLQLVLNSFQRVSWALESASQQLSEWATVCMSNDGPWVFLRSWRELVPESYRAGSRFPILLRSCKTSSLICEPLEKSVPCLTLSLRAWFNSLFSPPFVSSCQMPECQTNDAFVC